MKYLIKIIFLSAILLILLNCSKNSPPATPSSPSGPSTGEAKTILTFASSTTDPDGDDISYQFDWGDGNLSQWSNFLESGDTVSATHTWYNTGNYNISVRANDTKDKITEWSPPLSIIITPYDTSNMPPNQPSAPTGVDSGHTSTTYTFYASTTDPEGDSISYQFDWGDGTLSYWSDFLPSGNIIASEHKWTEKGSYSVRVHAKDEKEATSEWSQQHRINISDIPRVGLVAEYLFNGNANDESGNGNHGTLYGNASVASVLKIGDNIEDYMTVPHTVLNGLGDFTISLFIKLNTIHREGRDPGHAIISCSRINEDNAFLLFHNFNLKAWEFSIEDSRQTLPTDTTIFDKEWHSLIFMRNGTNGFLYTDGKALYTYVGGITLNIGAGGIIIGQEQDLVSDTVYLEQSQSLAGEIDNLRIYNRALSDKEIQGLYNEER
jgi:hypothetical protein